MKYIIIGVVVALFAFYMWHRSFDGGAGTVFEKDDPRLLIAKQRAHETLPAFWGALERGDPLDEMFVLKFNLNHDSGLADSELIRAGDIVRRDGRIFGTLVNEPLNTQFRIDQEVEILAETIVDWGYFREGVARHHVTRL